MNTVPLLPALAFVAVLVGGCSARCPYLPQDSTKYTLENTEKFMLLDEASQHSLGSTGLSERLLPDGRLEAAVNLRNRENRPLQVQVKCIFKDEKGMDTGDESPWRTLELAASASEAVRFTARSVLSRKYTIQVRQAR